MYKNLGNDNLSNLILTSSECNLLKSYKLGEIETNYPQLFKKLKDGGYITDDPQFTKVQINTLLTKKITFNKSLFPELYKSMKLDANYTATITLNNNWNTLQLPFNSKSNNLYFANNWVDFKDFLVANKIYDRISDGYRDIRYQEKDLWSGKYQLHDIPFLSSLYSPSYVIPRLNNKFNNCIPLYNNNVSTYVNNGNVTIKGTNYPVYQPDTCIYRSNVPIISYVKDNLSNYPNKPVYTVLSNSLVKQGDFIPNVNENLNGIFFGLDSDCAVYKLKFDVRSIKTQEDIKEFCYNSICLIPKDKNTKLPSSGSSYTTPQSQYSSANYLRLACYLPCPYNSEAYFDNGANVINSHYDILTSNSTLATGIKLRHTSSTSNPPIYLDFAIERWRIDSVFVKIGTYDSKSVMNWVNKSKTSDDTDLIGGVTAVSSGISIPSLRSGLSNGFPDMPPGGTIKPTNTGGKVLGNGFRNTIDFSYTQPNSSSTSINQIDNNYNNLINYIRNNNWITCDQMLDEDKAYTLSKWTLSSDETYNENKVNFYYYPAFYVNDTNGKNILIKGSQASGSNVNYGYVTKDSVWSKVNDASYATDGGMGMITTTGSIPNFKFSHVMVDPSRDYCITIPFFRSTGNNYNAYPNKNALTLYLNLLPIRFPGAIYDKFFKLTSKIGLSYGIMLDKKYFYRKECLVTDRQKTNWYTYSITSSSHGNRYKVSVGGTDYRAPICTLDLVDFVNLKIPVDNYNDVLANITSYYIISSGIDNFNNYLSTMSTITNGLIPLSNSIVLYSSPADYANNSQADDDKYEKLDKDNLSEITSTSDVLTDDMDEELSQLLYSCALNLSATSRDSDTVFQANTIAYNPEFDEDEYLTFKQCFLDTFVDNNNSLGLIGLLRVLNSDNDARFGLISKIGQNAPFSEEQCKLYSSAYLSEMSQLCGYRVDAYIDGLDAAMFLSKLNSIVVPVISDHTDDFNSIAKNMQNGLNNGNNSVLSSQLDAFNNIVTSINDELNSNYTSYINDQTQDQLLNTVRDQSYDTNYDKMLQDKHNQKMTKIVGSFVYGLGSDVGVAFYNFSSVLKEEVTNASNNKAFPAVVAASAKLPTEIDHINTAITTATVSVGKMFKMVANSLIGLLANVASFIDNVYNIEHINDLLISTSKIPLSNMPTTLNDNGSMNSTGLADFEKVQLSYTVKGNLDNITINANDYNLSKILSYNPVNESGLDLNYWIKKFSMFTNLDRFLIFDSLGEYPGIYFDKFKNSNNKFIQFVPNTHSLNLNQISSPGDYMLKFYQQLTNSDTSTITPMKFLTQDEKVKYASMIAGVATVVGVATAAITGGYFAAITSGILASGLTAFTNGLALANLINKPLINNPNAIMSIFDVKVSNNDIRKDFNSIDNINNTIVKLNNIRQGRFRIIDLSGQTFSQLRFSAVRPSSIKENAFLVKQVLGICTSQMAIGMSMIAARTIANKMNTFRMVRQAKIKMRSEDKSLTRLQAKTIATNESGLRPLENNGSTNVISKITQFGYNAVLKAGSIASSMFTKTFGYTAKKLKDLFLDPITETTDERVKKLVDLVTALSTSIGALSPSIALILEKINKGMNLSSDDKEILMRILRQLI